MTLKTLVRDSFRVEPVYIGYENLWKSSLLTSTERRYIVFIAYVVQHIYFALFHVPFYL